MPNFAAQHSLFRAYDIRGTRDLFSHDFVTALGVALSSVYRDRCLARTSATTVVIGYDARARSDTIAERLTQILAYHGLTVITLGLITTPMMAFWAARYDGHGIMVTASHSAKDNLGVKWLVDNASPSATDIQTLYQRLPATADLQDFDTKIGSSNQNRSQNKSHNQNTIIALDQHTVATTYIDAIAAVFARLYPTSQDSKINLCLVIDCLHGATSQIAYPLFKRFFTRVIMLNDTPDGSFPTGNPDPTEPNRLAELQQTVIITNADVGLAFDGDGDRLMVVDNSGKVIAPDHLLYLLAQVALTEQQSKPSYLKTHQKHKNDDPQVLFDIKCSHHLPILLKRLGAVPVMTRTGSSLLRQQLQSNPCALFAGELSGHFIFNDGHHIVYDDAMYAGLRLLLWLRRSNYVKIEAIDQAASFDVWGEPKQANQPYAITDITGHLPTLVSTADHYLPLPARTACGCSMVKRLTEFCHYLQTLVQRRGDCDDDNNNNALPPCTCHHTSPSMTSTQARRLLPIGTRLSCIDGVRLDFAHGFGVLRQSNTSHSLTVRFAGDSLRDLQNVQARFVRLCQPFDSALAAQIGAIAAE